MNKVTENRRKGDQYPELALLAEVFKLLGNGAYGKVIEGVERQPTVKYTKKENILMRDLRSVWFQDLKEIGDVYEIEMRKRKVVINRPFQVRIAVYQMAKLRILLFYYDCLDRYLDRRDFKLMQMDTDNLYFGQSRKTLEEAVRPEMREELEARKKEWFAWDKWSGREPGLIKLEFEGKRGIALCSKCYFMAKEDG